jgi:trimethylamine--corrinoid protein Co-methyltransferase
MKKMDILSPADVEQIHEASMQMLENTGVEFHHEDALATFRQAGLRVEGTRVYFTREIVMESVAKAPSEFTLHARNPENNLTVGGDNTIYVPGYGAPFIYEIDGTRRNATYQDYVNITRLAGASKNVDMVGGTVVEPEDLPDNIRPLKMFAASITEADKCVMGDASGKKRAKDCLAMASIVFGKEFVEKNAVMISLINSVTPMKFDDRMLEALLEYVKAGQAVVIASLTMAGSTGPGSIAGAATVCNAEVLAGITLAQLVRPGAPVVYGSASSITDMQSGSLVIGTPETSLFIATAAQMARFYNVPSRSGGGLNDAKIVDAQCGYEAMMGLHTATASGINYVLHAAGIMQHYMAMSYEKFMLDDEICGMVRRFERGYEINEESLAVDVVHKVGPGGHFLTQKHTRKFHRKDFRLPALSDRSSYDMWESAGKKTATERCKEKWQEVLANYQVPALPEDTLAELERYIVEASK